MNLQRFQELCAAYGADPRRWPEAERPLFGHHAQTLEGTAALKEAARIDAFLQNWHDPALDEARVARILAASSAIPRQRVAVAWLSTGFAASALLGFLLGFLQGSTENSGAELADLLLGNSVMEEIQ